MTGLAKEQILNTMLDLNSWNFVFVLLSEEKEITKTTI